ncbi:MAG TPA: hypothetical protein VFB15_03995 [Candidatus Binataceae bacterium]|nr:hypothetical protein [Candidatus Binataceae bacterium]
MMVAGVPLVVAHVNRDQHPSFTMDICHPAQSVSVESTHCSLPLPSAGTNLATPPFDLAALDAAQPPSLRSPEQPPAPPPRIAFS